MKRVKGFTLKELMIVIAIIGVLSAFAYPSYMQYKIRTSRAEMQTDMIQVAQRLQLYKQVNNSYSGALLSTSGIRGGSNFPATGTILYQLTLSIDADNQGWTLTANPDASGVAANSRQKGNGAIVLNSQGQKCWTKTATACTPASATDWSAR